MNLPHHRRYNWNLVGRKYKRIPVLLLMLVLMALIIWFGDRWLAERDNFLGYRLAVLDATGQGHRLAHFGAPGYVDTDWKEGTEGMPE